MASSFPKQSKVTDFYRQTRSRRSPSPKRAKQVVDIPRDLRPPQTSPANIRVQSPEKNTAELELPADYVLLLNFFTNADQLVAIMYSRQELITFTKLQSGVQKMTRRNFSLKNLGQIKTVYPEAYDYEQQRMTRQAVILQNRSADYELTIKPNLMTDLSNYGMQTPMKSPQKRVDVTPTKTPPRTPMKRPYFALSLMMKTPTKPANYPSASVPDSPSTSARTPTSSKQFSGGRLIARGQIFRRNLFGILKDRHKDFLTSLPTPIQLSEDDERRLTSWHPNFLLAEQLLEISASELPEAPVIERIASAKDLLGTSKLLISPMKVGTVGTKPNESDAAKMDTPASVPAKLKRVPPELLEKVRAKERQRKLMAMLRTPEEEIRQLRLSRLPDFVRIINMYFATESKLVMPTTQVYKKISESYTTPMPHGDIVEHVKLLRELVPDWMTQTDIAGKGSYLRLNHEVDITDALKKLGK